MRRTAFTVTRQTYLSGFHSFDTAPAPGPAGRRLTGQPQQLTLEVDWTSDQIAGATASASTDHAPVAGQANVKLALATGLPCVGATVTKFVIHEMAGHTADVPANGQNYNQPMSATVPPFQWGHTFAWSTWVGHNGPHQIDATVGCTLMISHYPPLYQYVEVARTLIVDVQNMQATPVTPLNPEPIRWDPDTMTGAPLSPRASESTPQ